MKPAPDNEARDPVWLGVLKNQVASLRFGTVHVVVHEAQVVQIEKTEKVRFDKPGRDSATAPLALSRPEQVNPNIT